MIIHNKFVENWMKKVGGVVFKANMNLYTEL